MKAIVTAVVAALAIVVSLFVSVPAQAAGTECVWITAEARGNDLTRVSGSKECESWSTVKRVESGVEATCSQGYRVVLFGSLARYCQMSTWVHTTDEPPITVGSPGSTARKISDSMKAKAAAHGLVLQFARVDGLGRSGCPATSPTWMAAATWPSDVYGERPGYGLIRVSAGGNPESCLRYWVKGWNTAYHEIAHQKVARHCDGDMEPPVAGTRGQQVTGAYAAMYLGSSVDDHTSGYVGADTWRAWQIRKGNCDADPNGG
jgi:hypothetical protein